MADASGGAGVLDGKVVVITGSGRGLGAAYARLAAREGARVVVNGVDCAASEGVAAEIVAADGDAIAIPCDIASWETASGLIQGCLDAYGTIDALCNNAALFWMAHPFNEDPAAFARMIEVNLLGTAYVGMAAARAMRAQGKSGAILNTVSGAQSGLAESASYGASKGGIAALSYSWAIDLAPHGIRVNAISPRADTRSARLVDPDVNKGLAAEDIAPLAIYLLSDRSRAFNGQVFMAQGEEIGLVSHPAIVVPTVTRPVSSVVAVDEALRSLQKRQLPVGRSRQRVEVVEELGALVKV